MINDLSLIFPLPTGINVDTIPETKTEELENTLYDYAETLYEQREKELGPENMRLLERVLMLRTIDGLWREHINDMDNMRLQAGWETLRQVKAVDAYKNHGYVQFQNMLANIRHQVTHMIYRVNLVKRETPTPSGRTVAGRGAVAGQPQPMAAGSSSKPQSKPVTGQKVGRNDPCPCGSGKKYKKCCGK